MLERPYFASEKFVCFPRERNETFSNEKNIRIKILIWFMVSEMVKKY